MHFNQSLCFAWQVYVLGFILDPIDSKILQLLSSKLRVWIPLLGRSIDGLGGGNLLRRSVDGLGGGYLLKRSLNSLRQENLDGLGGGNLLKRWESETYPKRVSSMKNR